jgi:molybdopterin synthase sulfur carrier subunit
MRILYFAALAEKLGSTQDELTLPNEVQDVRGLLAWLRTRGGVWEQTLADDKVRVLVNRQFVVLDTRISADDEVAIV